MADIFRTLIVPEAQAQLARDLAALAPGGAGMFTTGLSADGAEPATHYISTGLLPESFVAPLPLQVWAQEESGWVLVESLPGDPVAVYDMAVAGGLSVTQAEVDALFAASDSTTQEPFVAMGRLGLKIVTPPEPTPDP